MKNIKKTSNLVVFFLAALLYTSCETIDMDLKENPNGITLENADVDFYLNGVQVNFAKNMQEYGRTAMEVTRITNMAGRNYQNAYSPASLDSKWDNSYIKILTNIRLMNEKAEAKGLKYHIGIGQVIEAYTIVNLVDFFGDVPYREALDTKNMNPKLDPGSQVYDDALVLLDKAIANFSGTSNVTTSFSDLYYNKSWSKWINLANSIKLKIYIQKRLVDPTAITKFNAIISSGKYIQNSTDDFEFNWSTNVTNPDSRSPLFVDNYLPTGANEYMSNWFMDIMQSGKSKPDPRMKFYFYRQVNSSDTYATGQFLKCSIEPEPQHYIDGNYTYCVLSNGYWGRDHGDNFGTPPDADKKTDYGVYPAGGKFDDNTFAKITNLSGAKGDGIVPILLASTIDFFQAEAALNGGVGDAKSLIVAGIQKSFTKVRGFAAKDKTANLAKVPLLTADTAYITEFGTAYDAASGKGKMELLSKEFFVSLFGNGIDAYNFYRRTGFPNRIQPNLEPSPGAFIRSFYYAANETSANTNVPQKSNVTTRVFWDNNPSTGFPIGN
jgi:hypothetical protein